MFPSSVILTIAFTLVHDYLSFHATTFFKLTTYSLKKGTVARDRLLTNRSGAPCSRTTIIPENKVGRIRCKTIYTCFSAEIEGH